MKLLAKLNLFDYLNNFKGGLKSFKNDFFISYVSQIFWKCADFTN